MSALLHAKSFFLPIILKCPRLALRVSTAFLKPASAGLLVRILICSVLSLISPRLTATLSLSLFSISVANRVSARLAKPFCEEHVQQLHPPHKQTEQMGINEFSLLVHESLISICCSQFRPTFFVSKYNSF